MKVMVGAGTPVASHVKFCTSNSITKYRDCSALIVGVTTVRRVYCLQVYMNLHHHTIYTHQRQ